MTAVFHAALSMHVTCTLFMGVDAPYVAVMVCLRVCMCLCALPVKNAPVIDGDMFGLHSARTAQQKLKMLAETFSRC